MLHGRCHLHPCEKSRVEKCLFPAKLMALITSSASQLPKQIAALLGLSKANRLTDLNSHRRVIHGLDFDLLLQRNASVRSGFNSQWDGIGETERYFR